MCSILHGNALKRTADFRIIKQNPEKWQEFSGHPGNGKIPKIQINAKMVSWKEEENMSEMNQNNNGPVKGAIHSIERGSVDGPRRTLRDFCEGLQHALPVLPQPGHLTTKRCRLADRRRGAEKAPAKNYWERKAALP